MSVTVRGLTKRFGGAPPVVDGVSFEAPAGEITAVLGPSGAGKSTVLRLLAGLEHADAGEIHIDGVERTHAPPKARNVGFVFQGYALFPNLTAAENVAFGLSVRGIGAAELRPRVQELMSLMQLDGLAERYPSELSGGQRQRVALARALAPRPSVLLLDEPFGALDARVRRELRGWLRTLHESTKVTTLLVTHDQEEALELSEHVVIMNRGEVAQAGSPREVYDHPATPFVAAFVGGANELGVAVASNLAARREAGGTPPRAYVRPSEVRLLRAHEQAHGVESAVIERVRVVGGTAKVELRLAAGELLAVELPRHELDGLGLAEGETAHVDLRAAKLFVEDYVI